MPSLILAGFMRRIGDAMVCLLFSLPVVLVVSCAWGLLGRSSQIFAPLFATSCNPVISGVLGFPILLVWGVVVLF
jgi:hypothetical protein